MSRIKKLLVASVFVLPLMSCGTTLSMKAWQAPSLNPAPGSIIAFYEKGKYVNLDGGVATVAFIQVSEDFEEIISNGGGTSCTRYKYSEIGLCC